MTDPRLTLEHCFHVCPESWARVPDADFEEARKQKLKDLREAKRFLKIT